MKIINVVGARPNFMKIAPIMREMKKAKGLKPLLVHTGQHYDHKMSKSFFEDLSIPKPDINLGVGSGSHTEQTARIMLEFEKVCLKHKPDLILVVGDVNSTLACSLVGSKLRIAVAHVEAGLRSYDRDMPEEINRLVTDAVSDVYFTTSEKADLILKKEGQPMDRTFFVGNVMIDTLLYNLPKAKKSNILKQLGVSPSSYALVTLHRPSNVDNKDVLKRIMEGLIQVSQDVPLIFPVHPRTKNNMDKFLPKRIKDQMKSITFLEPQGYFEFLNLTANSKLVLTDSGGIQEETTVLGVPCLTIRENTERPITITQGTNILVGTDTKKIISESKKILKGKVKKGRRPKFWDGKAAVRIVKKIQSLHNKGQLLR